MPEAPGSTLGPFRIVAPIGSGGFATVYRARDERLDDDVAIKVLAENHSLDPDIRERFLREARLLRTVASDHVVSVFDIGETDRLQPYLVLEYAAGGDLRRRVERAWESGEQPAVADLEVVARALGSGLDAIHTRGIVHRDISPGNILLLPSPHDQEVEVGRVLAPDERLVLADLGLAKDLSRHSGLTVGGGTHGFSAPEQRGDVGAADHPADVYSASAVLAWMCTTESPENVSGKRAADRLRGLGVPLRLASALGRGLAHDPDDRQADIASWQREVLDALTPEPTVAGPAVTTEVERPAPTGRRRIALAIGVALLVLVAAVGTALVVAPDDDGVRRTELEDGRVRVQRTHGDVRVAIFGPDRVSVGDTAVFEAGVVGGADYAWVTPEGTLVRSEPELEVTAVSAGTAIVELVVTDPDGGVVTVEHRLRIDEN